MTVAGLFSVNPSCSSYSRLEDGDIPPSITANCVQNDDIRGLNPQNSSNSTSPPPQQQQHRIGVKQRIWFTICTAAFIVGCFWFNLDQIYWNLSQQSQINSLSQRYRSLSQKLSGLYSDFYQEQSIVADERSHPDNSLLKPYHLGNLREFSTVSENDFEMPRKRLPGALIIGARKCGTRALLEFLNLHPDIRTARYELHFFDNNETYVNGLEWYREKMPTSTPRQITLEKTPAYFTSSVTPERVFQMNSTIKIILILRDPVIRTISDYTQVHYTKLSKNKTHAPFEQLVFNEDTGMLNTDYKPVRNSLYVKHLRRWLKFFPLKNIQIVDGDRFIRSPLEELRKIETFLNLREGIHSSQLYFNATKGFYCFKPSSSHGAGGGHGHVGFLKESTVSGSTPFGRVKPSASLSTNNNNDIAAKLTTTATTTKCLGDSKGRPHVHVSETVRNRLAEELRPFTEKFFTLANIRFDKWI